MNRLFLFIAGLSVAVCSALAQPELPAKLALFVIEDGRPVENVRVFLRGEPYGSTGSHGSAFVRFAPGEATLELKRLDATLVTLKLNVVSREDLQIIAVLNDDGPPRVDIESSNQTNQGITGQTADAAPVGDPGVLTGQVFSTESGDPVINARVFISGTASDVRTDSEGRYEISLAPGTYAISVIHADHSTQTLDEIEVSSGEATSMDVELTPAALELPEFVVLEPFIEGSIASVIEERRNSAAVTDILGAEQFAKTGDSDAAGALKRVTGLSLVDGKFIYVRGMGERYSTTLVNGAVVPSPDPTRRVVPLDLFPTGVIGNIAVQKSFSATMPGEFGGGTVDLRTRGIPDGQIGTIGFGVEYDTETTGKDIKTYRGGGSDWTGWDDGTRGFPSILQRNLRDTKLCRASRFAPDCFEDEQIQEFGQAVAGNYDFRDREAIPNAGLDLTYGNVHEFAGLDFGYVAAVSFDHSLNNNDEIRREFAAGNDPDDPDGIVLSTQREFDVVRSERQVDSSAFITAELAKEQLHKILYTSLFVRLTVDETRVDEGVDGSLGFDDQIRRVRLEWIENDLLMNQFRGEHVFPFLADLKLDWQYTDARARLDSPNTRTYRFDDRGATGDFALSTFADSNSQSWAGLEDNSQNYQGRLTLPFEFANNKLYGQFAGGYDKVKRDRDSFIRRFDFGRCRDNSVDQTGDSLDAIINNETVNPDCFTLRETTRSTDAYQAFQTLESFFLELDTTWFEKLRASFGVRFEDNEQLVVNEDPLSSNPQRQEASVATSDTLPAAALTYFLTDSMQVRASYAETLSRPDFRELSPAPFIDPVFDAEVLGNPDLKPATITNWDIRWEWYPSPGESLSVGWFKKDFTNPIEAVVIAGEDLRFTLQNALGATNTGIEAEFRKEMGFLASWLDGIIVSANGAIIDSEIEFDADDALSQTSNVRPLQGQSEYTLNIQIGYENLERDISATLAFNVAGERISQVGVSGLPDVFEQPFEQLDLTYRQGFGDRWKLKAAFKNILDPTVEFSQLDSVTREFKKGREFSVGVDFSF